MLDNPFNYIKIDIVTEKVIKRNEIDKYNTEDVEKISNRVCANEETSLLMQSIMHMMIDTYEINWLTSEKIILLAGQKECYWNENSKQTNLDELFEFIRKEDDNHIAVIKYDEFNELPIDVRLEAIEQLKDDLLNFVVNEKTVEELGIRCINCPNMLYVEGKGGFCMHDMLEESAVKYEDTKGEKISKNKKAIDKINSLLDWCPLIDKLFCDRLAKSVERVEREVFKIIADLSMTYSDETGMLVEVENNGILDESLEKIEGLESLLGAIRKHLGGKTDSG